MFGNDIEGRYRHDSTFRRVVDQMRALLSAYHITPGELREASILAATMHESENIRPLYITRIDEIQRAMWPAIMQQLPFDMNPPAMFGGSRTGRWVTSTPNVTEQDKAYKCICGAIGALALHTQTCRDYNWNVVHPVKPQHTHYFTDLDGRNYRVCSCGISNIYYNSLKS
jgi:hypothetical protein